MFHGKNKSRRVLSIYTETDITLRKKGKKEKKGKKGEEKVKKEKKR